ncbi:MAG: alpha-amylase, partial [Planctomycetia bacterium]
FRPEPLDDRRWRERLDAVDREATAMLDRLRADHAGFEGDAAAAVDRVLEARSLLKAFLAAAAGKAPGGVVARLHGDFHLGQVLIAGDDVYLVDFEGEPLRPLEERRRKQPLLKDVAGMLRSFDYARHVALREGRFDARKAVSAEQWRAASCRAFLSGYRSVVKGSALVPEDPGFEVLLVVELIEKVCYEVEYERKNRPTWLPIPLAGFLEALPPAWYASTSP